MKLRDVECIMNAEIYKNILVVVKVIESIFKKCKGFVSVDRILCEVNEVQQSSDCSD